MLGASVVKRGAVRFWYSLSNLGAPVDRLLQALKSQDAEAGVQPPGERVGAEVATEVRENRILSPAEVAELVAVYRSGVSARELARRLGLHRDTVARHLERAGVVKRERIKMTPARVERAAELYAAGWSTQRIGTELGASAGAVCRALKKAGVRMRPPVALRFGSAT